MPIPESEFNRGKSEDSPLERIEQLLRRQAHEAFSLDDIVEALDLQTGNQWDRLLVQIDLQSLSREGIVEQRKVANGSGTAIFYKLKTP